MEEGRTEKVYKRGDRDREMREMGERGRERDMGRRGYIGRDGMDRKRGREGKERERDGKRGEHSQREWGWGGGGGGRDSRMDGYKIEKSVSKCNPRSVISSSIWFQCTRNTKDIKFYSLSEAPVKDETPRSVQR